MAFEGIQGGDKNHPGHLCKPRRLRTPLFRIWGLRPIGVLSKSGLRRVDIVMKGAGSHYRICESGLLRCRRL